MSTQPRRPRYDGLEKVTGAKVYARDLRPSDPQLSGWPTRLYHVLLLRAGRADAPFLDVTRADFPEALRPDELIDAGHLKKKGIVENTKFGRSWLVEKGARPEHRGQPIAILYYEDAQRLANARAWLRAGGSPARFGPAAAPVETDIRRIGAPLLGISQRDPDGPSYGSEHLVRIADEGNQDVFSYMKDGAHSPIRIAPGTPIDKRETLACNREARAHWDAIERLIAEEGWDSIDRSFSTSTVDPMFMEPEAGLAYWDERDPQHRALRLVIGTQSPSKDRENVARLFPTATLEGVRIELRACYPGGGFGGRDESSLAMYLALAAFFADRPVRIAFDRYEQFQVGIKRHAAVVRNRLAWDRQGNLQALISTTLMDGGGEANLTMPVVGLAVLHAAGPYRIPRTALEGFGVRTPGSPSGSMRGFGIPQVAFAIESMIDEVASRLHVDPIEYRLDRVLRVGDRDVTGMRLEHHLANRKICELAGAEDLWRRREERRLSCTGESGIARGVGFAMCMEAYGTTSDAAFAEVSLSRDGRIEVASSAVDMGQGPATAIREATVALFGRPADTVHTGESERFAALELQRKDEPVPPNGTPKIVNAMSASMTAFHKLQAVEEACRVLWDHGLRPAAEALAGCPIGEPAWEGGHLRAGDRRISWAELCAALHERRLVTSAMVHSYFQGRFASAEFTVADDTSRREIDALAVRFGDQGGYKHIARQNQRYPTGHETKTRRTLYASVGHLVGVEVHLRSGAVRVTDAVTILDAGRVHHPELLAGQVEGGLAMGIGMALLEELPPSPEGNDDTWNLHRYQVPRAGHMPLHSMRLVLVPFGEGDSVLAEGPVGETRRRQPRKGIAEATMSSVAPAIANAVAHATGIRVNRLPFTRTRVLEALGQR